MQRIITFSTGLIALLIMMQGCQKTATEKRIPFAEGKSLTCPENTKKAETLNTSYPEYFCVGTDGKSGPWLEFDVNGRIRTRTEYVNDKINGQWIHYHPDGQIDTQGQMENDLRVGAWTQFYINGEKRSIKTYAGNKLNGPLKLFYQTGGLMAEGTFKDDFEEGPWKVYTPEGELARECVMVHGKETNCVIHIKDFQPATYRYNSEENGAL